MQNFCAFTHKILHIITSKTINLSIKGLTASFLKFSKSLQAFILKGFRGFLKIKLPLGYHF